MTTKEQFLKDESKSFENDNSNQYSCINLNQNQKCLDFSIVQSNSKPNNDKFWVSNNCEEKEKSQKWNKTSQFSNFSNNELKEGHKNHWTKDDSLISATNKSIILLHIYVYENSNECTNSNSSSIIQNLFEFPRQQERGKTPEIAQFKASQELLSYDKIDIEQKSSGPNIITINGHIFRYRKTLKNSKLRFWYCGEIRSGCNGDVCTTAAREVFLQRCKPHNCGFALPVPNDQCVRSTPVQVGMTESQEDQTRSSIPDGYSGSSNGSDSNSSASDWATRPISKKKIIKK